MPKGTRVSNCVEDVKAKGGGNPYAICQKATHESYATGKPLHKYREKSKKLLAKSRKK